MTEKWISNAKHWCKFCKVFIDGKPRSIKVHELGDMHKTKVSQHLNQLSKQRLADEKFNGAMTKELREIEIAAIKAGNRDIATGHKTGYRNAALAQPASVVLGDKSTRYAATTWADIQTAQFVEHDPSSFDYIAHYNKEYGHVSDGKTPLAADPNEANAELLDQVEQEEAAKEWQCGTCGQSNFASRKACRKCKNKRAVVEKVADEEYPGWVYDEGKQTWRRKEEVLADQAEQARIAAAEAQIQQQREAALAAQKIEEAKAAVEETAAKLKLHSKSKTKQAVIDEVESDILAAEREAAAQGIYHPSAPPGIVHPVLKPLLEAKTEAPPVDVPVEKLATDPKKRRKQLGQMLWQEAGLCQTMEAAQGVVELAEQELRQAILALSKLGPETPPLEREMSLQGVTKLKQRIEVFKQRAEEIKQKSEPPPLEEPDPQTAVDEATGMGGWVVADKPLYSERETAPQQPKKRKRKKQRNGEEAEESESEENEGDEEDDTGIDRNEYLADFGFSALVKVPKQKKKESSSDEDDDAAQQKVLWKKRTRPATRRPTRGI